MKDTQSLPIVTFRPILRANSLILSIYITHFPQCIPQHNRFHPQYNKSMDPQSREFHSRQVYRTTPHSHWMSQQVPSFYPQPCPTCLLHRTCAAHIPADTSADIHTEDIADPAISRTVFFKLGQGQSIRKGVLHSIHSHGSTFTKKRT